MNQKIIQLILTSLKEKELLDDEGVGYGDFPFTRDEFLDAWESLAMHVGYDSSKSDEHNDKFCSDGGFDEKLVFIEYDGFQFILREICCGQMATQMIIPNTKCNLPWKDDKKTVVYLNE